MREVVIVGGYRTPFVKAGAQMRFTPTQELGRAVTKELLYRFELDPSEVDELIAGNVGTPPDATNVARVISLMAGIPKDKVAHSVNRNCASGMEAVTQAYDRIRTGQADTVIAVGVESMSNAPVLFQKQFAEHLLELSKAKNVVGRVKTLARVRPKDLAPQIGLKIGLTDPTCGLMMGDTADKLSREFGISRAEQDAFALESHRRASEAWKAGRLREETIPIYAEPKMTPITQDIGPRDNQTIEALGKLKPFFDKRYGTVTVGNACQVTDGAVALLLMSAEKAKALGYKPLGRIREYAYAGCDPARMGLGPVFSSHKALSRAGWSLADIDLVEINEAFAAQVLACTRAMGSGTYCQSHLGRDAAMGEIDPARLNVNGGAIALGHPVGATGARIVLTLLNELRRRGKARGLATLCVGGGQGGAVLVEAEAA